MLNMVRVIAVLACLLSNSCLGAQDEKHPSYPSYDYETTRSHEIKPHRRTIPVDGAHPGFNQLHLALTVSAAGDIIDANASGNPETLKFWPQLQNEVYQWKFTPFEENGKAITADVEEYLDLVPPERLPKKLVPAPALRPNSKVSIILERTGCFGSCPSYTVAVNTDGIVFDGHGFTVALGKHRDTISADEVREFAKKFIAADFYSMDAEYSATVTDLPTYMLSIAIDGQTKKVVDYEGSWVGMPAIIVELEDAVDIFTHTQRWIAGDEGLVQALQAEQFNFRTFEAQVMLKEAARRGQTATVHELLEADVPLKPLPAPKPKESYMSVPYENAGWLNAASNHPETLKLLIAAAASKNDQNDKDLALAGAARSGNVEAVLALIAYGADPNADLSKLTVEESSDVMTLEAQGAGSILIYAAESGNPEMVREILRYHPRLETRDREGKTAIFASGEYRQRDNDSARVECVRLLAEAGANINARDNNGNTPLHEIFLTDVEEELLKLGADVNARNHDGETPIFTNVNTDAISLFIEHGADLTIRNNNGETVMEAAKNQGPLREAALRKAIQLSNDHQKSQ